MVRVYSRLNGWMPPPHPLQVMAWIMVLCLTASTFGVLAPSFACLTIRITVYTAMALMIFINIVANIVVTTIDPADEAVRKKIRNNPRPGFDREKHRHVIDENYFCNICETIIQPSSKHCRQCNKCVLDFDHHCKWLNNCIGARNYRWFLFYVVSTALTSFCILALSLTLFVFHFVDRGSLYQEEGCLTVFGLQTKDALWLTLIALTMTLATVAAILLMHLLIFHLRIVKKGMTTYNYIMEQRKKDEEREKLKVDAAATAAAKAAANTIASGARLFSQAKLNPMSEISHKSHPATDVPESRGRLKKLKQLLQLRKERVQNPGHQNANLALIGLPHPKNGFLAQDLPKRKLAASEELVMVDPSSDSGKTETRKEETQNGDGKRAITPLPPIVQKTATRAPAIASFIQTPTPANSESVARRKKRAASGATSVQSPVPYEIMEDKENRISVSHIAAALPSETPKSKPAANRGDSAALNAFSRHADVPRLPPLPSGTNAGQNAKSTLVVSGSSQPDSIFLRSALTGDDLASSLNNPSTDREDTLREIPLYSFSRRQESIGSGPPAVDIPMTNAQRISSGSSSGSSGSILAPLQVEALTADRSGYVGGGRYFGQVGQRVRSRPLPPLVAGRHHETLISMTNDYDSRISQFSDSGSLSSGSKRVRFSGSPKLKRNTNSFT